jgi:hypothetical protein
MGILSDFFIAGGEGVPEYDGGKGFAPEDVCTGKGLTPLQAAQLLGVLRGEGTVLVLIDEFKMLTPPEGESFTMSVPQDMVEGLAKLDDAGVSGIAAGFAEATAAELGWSASDCEPVIAELAALARRAIAQSKRLYLWNCL